MHYKEDPTPIQLAALQRYANDHGRNWRSILANAWDAGVTPGISRES